MKAVNLIPADAKPTAAGRSGGGVHILLAGLAVLVLLVGAFVSTSNKVTDRKSQLAQVEAQAAAEAKAASLAPYSRFTEMRAARVQTVSSLVASRFDWSGVFHEIARVMPKDAWLNSMKGIVGDDPTAGNQSVAATGKIPKVDITGCTSGHKSVARMLVRLRLMDRVTRVGLTSSNASKPTDAPAGSAPATATAGGSGCAGQKRSAQFAITVSFSPISPGAPAAAPATASSTQPASTGATK